MKLSQLVGKEIYVGKNYKGICLGIGVSLKSGAIKYLFCGSDRTRHTPDYVVRFSAMETVEEHIQLSTLRPVYPQSCAKFFLATPVYSSEGAFLGNVKDIAIENGIFTRLYTHRESYPLSHIAACTDAVLLRKAMAYPLGQRIPAPVFSDDSTVTKNVLRGAIQSGNLIRLTLSLAPFHHTAYFAESFNSREKILLT